MSYAVWIALAVVMIAVIPPIIKSARAKNRAADGSGDTGSTSNSDSSCDARDGGDCAGD
ncbi:MAG: hypothetical protein ACKOUT_01270 [Novosphingobium sp.]